MAADTLMTATATRTIRTFEIAWPIGPYGDEHELSRTTDADEALDAGLAGVPVRRVPGYELGPCDCGRCNPNRG